MCSVVGCDSGRHGTQRFKLPEDPERRLEWVQFLLEVNGQRLKESSWTDITVCRHHFTSDCFVNLTPTGTVQLKPDAVPSVCVKSEPGEPEPCQEPEETTEAAFQYDELRACDSPSSYSEESGLTSTAAQQSPAPSDASDAFMSDYGQMLQNIVNIDMIKKKAAPLQVNEKHLHQLFSHKCPSCGSQVKMQKVTCGVLIIANQQCLQCEYRNLWKSQVNASVPTAEDQLLTEVVEVDVTPETKQTVSVDDNCSSIKAKSEMVAVEESEPIDETEESSDEGDMDSDDDDEFEEETDDEEEEDGDYPPLPLKHSRLCTECGKFFNKQKSHICEHKIKPYCCNICGKRCVSENALNSHSRIHDENYEYRCKFCHVKFKTKVDKFTHEQIHLIQGKPYKCTDCSETFATNKLRRIHLEDHRGPQQLKCHICGIEFTQTGHLQRHLAVHTGVKPFKCSVCQRGFSQAGHLKSHMRLHTGERPFKCQHCDKSFNHNVSLKSHVQRYHSSSSGRDRKKSKTNKTVSDAGDARENGSKRVTDSGLDNVEKEHNKEEEEKKERNVMPKCKKRSSGRPVGRPKRNSAENFVLEGEMQGQHSTTETAKVTVKLKKTRCSDEESEDKPTESGLPEASCPLTQKRSTSRSRGRARKSDSDSDFDPEERKKKRYSSQNRGKSSGKRRGRPRKNQVAKDT